MFFVIFLGDLVGNVKHLYEPALLMHSLSLSETFDSKLSSSSHANKRTHRSMGAVTVTSFKTGIVIFVHNASVIEFLGYALFPQCKSL